MATKPAAPAAPTTPRPRKLTLSEAEAHATAANAVLLQATERELKDQRKAKKAAQVAERAAQVAARTAADKATQAAANAAAMQRRLGTTPAPTAPAAAAPAAPATPTIPAPAPAAAPMVTRTPAAPAPAAAAPAAPATPTIPAPAAAAPVAPTPAPTIPAPAPVAAPVVNPTSMWPATTSVVAPTAPVTRFLGNWRNASIWTRIVIVLAAIVGAFIFLILGKATAGIIRWGTSDWWSWMTTGMVFIWQVGLIVCGFGLGGWLATYWFARRR